TRPIPLDLDRYGSAPDRVTFVVYFYDAPRDPFGNELNQPAATSEAPGVGTGGGTGPTLKRKKGSTAAASTAGGSRGGRARGRRPRSWPWRSPRCSRGGAGSRSPHSAPPSARRDGVAPALEAGVQGRGDGVRLQAAVELRDRVARVVAGVAHGRVEVLVNPQ